jgi:hypothetical protein
MSATWHETAGASQFVLDLKSGSLMISKKCITHWIFFSLIVCGAGLHAQQPVVAHVLDVTGEWRLHGTAGKVASGQALAAGALIDAVSNRPGDGLTILRDDDMSRQRMACDTSAANPCRSPMIVQASASEQSSGFAQLKGMLQAVVGVLLSKPPAIGSHYAMTLSRGAESVLELEGVAALDAAQGVVLPAPPPDVAAGPYTLSIVRTGNGAASQPVKQSARLTSEGDWRPIALDAAGVYEITIRNAQEESVANLMVLVTAPAEYADKQQRFDALKAHADTWTGPGARNDEHLLLRAFLLSESRP